MKSLTEQDHYEVLEVAWGAKAPDIERAYRIAHAAYAPDSLALYSVFDSSDANAILERIETAYRVLSDEQARAEYDAKLVASGGRGSERQSAASQVDAATAVPEDAEMYEALESHEDEGGDWNGSRLRRARLRRGVELEEVSSVTKISCAYLSHIEEDRYGELPAPVYVRGFVTAYARAIGLEPAPVTQGYMARLEEAGPRSIRGRLLARG